MAAPMHVTVVAPQGVIWEGESINTVVRTTEGDIGILSNHEPILAALIPCAAEIVTLDGTREIIAVEGGFISVYNNKISLLSDSAIRAGEISLTDARRELAELHEVINAGTSTDREERRYNQLLAQVKAGERYAEIQRG